MDSLLKQTIATATVKTGPIFNETLNDTVIVLRDSKSWSASLQKWTIGYEDTNLMVKDALIMKNGKRIKAEELKPNDKLYIVMNKDDLVGKVIVVK